MMVFFFLIIVSFLIFFMFESFLLVLLIMELFSLIFFLLLSMKTIQLSMGPSLLIVYSCFMVAEAVVGMLLLMTTYRYFGGRSYLMW